MFVFSSPLGSTSAIAIVKKLFLGNLRKRPRWNVKKRNCVQLIFSYQIRTGNSFLQTPAVHQDQHRGKGSQGEGLKLCDWYYKTILQLCNILLLFSCTVWAIHLPTLPSFTCGPSVRFGSLYHTGPSWALPCLTGPYFCICTLTDGLTD